MTAMLKWLGKINSRTYLDLESIVLSKEPQNHD